MIRTLFSFGTKINCNHWKNGCQFNTNHVIRRSSSKAFASDAERERKEKIDVTKIGLSLFDSSSVRNEPNEDSGGLVFPAAPTTKYQKVKYVKLRRPPVPIVRPVVISKVPKPNPPRNFLDTDLQLEYTRVGSNDRIVGDLLTDARKRLRSNPNGSIILEGKRLIADAVKCGMKIDVMLFSKKEEFVELQKMLAGKRKVLEDCQLLYISNHTLKIWSTLTTPPGVMAVCRKPTPATIARTLGNTKPLPITVICDQITNPSNLGSVIRTCAALPCKEVVVTKTCADPWDSSALRGGCGGQFRVPIRDGASWDKVMDMLPPDIVESFGFILAENDKRKLSSLRKRPKEYTEIEHCGYHSVVVVGDTNGICKEAYDILNQVGDRGEIVYVPVPKETAALNASSFATIILYELRKKFNALSK